MEEQKNIILLIEDNKGDSRLIREMIADSRTTKFDVDVASTLESSIQKLNENRYDIVISDLGLPDSQGIDTLKEIQKAVHKVPIIVLTGITDEEMGINAVKLGAQDYLIKNQLNKFSLIRAITYAIERKMSDEMLRENEELFRGAFEQAAVGLAHVSLEGRFLRFNNKLLEITGYSEKELSEKNFQEITHPEDLHKDVEQMEKLISGDIETYSMEKRYIRKDGSFVWVLLTGSMVRNEDGNPKYFIAVIENIEKRKNTELALMRAHTELEEKVNERTKELSVSNQRLIEEVEERRKAEFELDLFKEQLRALSIHLESVREEERLHIAREIHDEFSQKLSAVKIDVGLIYKQLTNKNAELNISQMKKELKSIYSTIEQIFSSVRHLLKKIRPELLEELGLLEALSFFIREYEERSGIKCNLIYSLESDPKDLNLSIQIYRIIQESLTNVLRHAGADAVDINISQLNNHIELNLHDNGMGFESDEAERGFGILGMKERAVSVGGNLDVFSSPNGGTLVKAAFPFIIEEAKND